MSRPKTVGPSLTYAQLAHSEHNDGSDDDEEDEDLYASGMFMI